MERETTELYPCPYSEVVRCCLQDPCKGCETWAKYLVGEETPRTLKQPERKTAEKERQLRQFVIQWGQEGMYDKTFEKALLTLINDYANQGIDWPSEEEIKKWANGIKLASIGDINPKMDDVTYAYRGGLIEGAKWLLNRVKK